MKPKPSFLVTAMLAGVLSFALAGQRSHAQSFPCSSASSEVEKYICGNSHLGEFDEEMGEVYKALLKLTPAKDKSAIIDGQRRWILRRNGDCLASDVTAPEDCLADRLERRRDELKELLRNRLGISPEAFAFVSPWSRTFSDIAALADDVKDRFGRCSGMPPTINPKFAKLVPPSSASLFAIATHACDAVLRVYLLCSSRMGIDTCSDEELLILEDIKNPQASVLGTLKTESRTGNSGGIFVPMAFTKDDRRIILRSWMGDSAAGGGSVDYGYEIMAREGSTDKRTPLAPGKSEYFSGITLFYDTFGKAVFTRKSDKLPPPDEPGINYNTGVIVVKDLVILREQKVLEERDTTFELVRADEQNHMLTIRAIKHRFSPDCPREQEGALSCSAKTVTERKIPLP